VKHILIIYPHWVPSNLAGVHRPRLIANHLREFGWEPILITVKSEFYEEEPDPDISKTVYETFEVHYVDANEIGAVRIIGDIGLRAFSTIKAKALELISNRKIDFIWIPIPSFYMALLGRQLFERTRIPYGIDYIDPWIRPLAAHQKILGRHWWSLKAAQLMEPYAVKKASLISGVSQAYYQPVLDKYFRNKEIHHVAMPYGFDKRDHELEIEDVQYPWKNTHDVKPIIYAGAFLPKSHLFVDSLFKAIRSLKIAGLLDKRIRLYFIGTGNYGGKKISDYALEHELEEHVIEINQRYPFLHILNILAKAWRVMIIGSTEKHYTASKTFQSLLSKRPVFAMFHQKSSAVNILEETKADQFLVKYFEEIETDQFVLSIKEIFSSFVNEEMQDWNPSLEILNKYAARESTRLLVEKIEEALQ
jgi:hypothetical protein